MLKKSLRIFAVPLFKDNYSYIVETAPKEPLFLVDPAEPSVVLECLRSYFPNQNVSHILYTHRHWDHAGGAQELYQALKNNGNSVEVFSGKEDAGQIGTVTKAFEKDEELDIGETHLKVLKVPCHTRGHVLYHLSKEKSSFENDSPQKSEEMKTIEGKTIRVFEESECVFTGDTLFKGAVGRFFEGNAEEMYENISKINKSFKEDCSLYNGHEYTLQAVKWCFSVEPNNKKMKELIEELETQKEDEICTLPTNLKTEKEINVFVRAVVNETNPLGVSGVEYLRALRSAKDQNSSNVKDFLPKL